jgi:large subunit ribosomal protein L22
MEARATARYIRVTPRKVNQVLDLVRGRAVEEALLTLTFSKKHVAKRIEKTVRSAVANAVQTDSALDVEDLYVKEALVGPGPIMKRWLPRAQGRATPILKRTSHITIILGDRPVRGKKARAGKKAAPAAKAAPKKRATAKPAAKTAAKAAAAKSTGAKAARAKAK